MKKSLVSLSVLTLALFSTSTFANDDLDLDSEGPKKKRKEFTVEIDQNVKEVTKGWYAKASVGGTGYVLALNGIVYPGATSGLGFGRDFVDQKGHSMAWEVMLLQGVHNGLYYEQQAAAGCVERGSCVQGDLRTFSLVGAAEVSWYPVQRLGIGLRAGGGVMMVPLLMNEDFYITEVVGEWSGIESSIHNGAKPIGMGGLTFEYYTKLAHFSVGLDVDASYVIGMDLGISGNGYLKYTF